MARFTLTNVTNRKYEGRLPSNEVLRIDRTLVHPGSKRLFNTPTPDILRLMKDKKIQVQEGTKMIKKISDFTGFDISKKNVARRVRRGNAVTMVVTESYVVKNSVTGNIVAETQERPRAGGGGESTSPFPEVDKSLRSVDMLAAEAVDYINSHSPQKDWSWFIEGDERKTVNDAAAAGTYDPNA